MHPHIVLFVNLSSVDDEELFCLCWTVWEPVCIWEPVCVSAGTAQNAPSSHTWRFSCHDMNGKHKCLLSCQCLTSVCFFSSACRLRTSTSPLRNQRPPPTRPPPPRNMRSVSTWWSVDVKFVCLFLWLRFVCVSRKLQQHQSQRAPPPHTRAQHWPHQRYARFPQVLPSLLGRGNKVI